MTKITKLQDNQEYMVANFSKSIMADENLKRVVNETFDQLEKGEIHWIHTQQECVLNAVNLNPTIQNVTLLVLSLSD